MSSAPIAIANTFIRTLTSKRKTWAARIGRLFAFLGAGLFLYALLAALLAVVPGRRATLPPGPRAEAVRFYLVHGPIHYDFLLPLDGQTRAAFGFAVEADLPIDDPAAKWLLIGWGAKEFYTTAGSYRDVTLGAVVKGLTGDASVMRMDLWGALPGSFPEGVPARDMWMGRPAYEAFLASIREDFAGDGAPRLIDGATLGGSDLFYEAKGRFHAFRTCNTWISRKLRAAGLRFGAWTPLPYSVTLSYRALR